MVLDQFEAFAPDVLALFQEIVATGQVEILSETYYHSLSFLYSREEFKEQVLLHRKKIQDVFGVTPCVFRNTELIYHNDVAAFVQEMGFHGVLAEGWDHFLQ